MFVPKTLSLLMDRLLPRRFIIALHKIYDPYFSWQLQRISRRLVNKVFPTGELQVMAGPFKNMRYIRASAGSVLMPKLIGSYEAELHTALEGCFRRNYETVVNIGCAEGYYLIGCAIRMPQATLHGFDTSVSALRKCESLAKLNKVDAKIHLHGTCTTEALRALLPEGSLVLSDCEGAETFLFDPAEVPKLNSCDFLIELHDREAPGATDLLIQRFSNTHEITLITPQPRDLSSIPFLAKLNPAEKAEAVNEFRSEHARWGVFLSRKNVKPC